MKRAAHPLAAAWASLVSAVLVRRATLYVSKSGRTRHRGEPGNRGYKHMRQYAKRYGYTLPHGRRFV